MKIYTGKGDLGETSCLDGHRVSKNDNIIHFIGTLDELNSHLGLIKSMLLNDNTWQFTWKSACGFIDKVQKNLMKIMSNISVIHDDKAENSFPLEILNEKYLLSDTDIKIMEKEIDRLSGNIPEQHGLVIPGSNIIEAQIHIARTVARRAERLCFAVNEKQRLNPAICAYINRLSDYLFVLSQQESLINVNFINQITGI